MYCFYFWFYERIDNRSDDFKHFLTGVGGAIGVSESTCSQIIR